MGKEIDLPSGAKLTVNAAPFSEAKKLWQACANELAHFKINASTEMDINFLKDLVCVASSSERIEAALAPCLRRCLYAGAKIDDGTFEGEDARQDYLLVLAEVLKANVFPFFKGLLSKLGIDWEEVTKSFAQKSSGN